MIVNGKRALAYVAKIDSITPLEGYDRVEYAHIGGWGIVVSKKDDFKAGDLCIYIETDSLCPKEDERFSFLESKHWKVKIQKMCKVYSQGLIMPLSAFPEITNPKEGMDVTDILGIEYYVPEDNKRKSDRSPNYKKMAARHPEVFKKKPIRWLMKRDWGKSLLYFFFGGKNTKSKSGSNFPTKFPYVSKTDEERIENLPHLIGYENPLVVTEKVDGTSTTYILERKNKNKFEFYVCSRNRRLTESEKLSDASEAKPYWYNADKYGVEEHLKEYMEDNPDLAYVCLQGESVGPSIQKNPLKLPETDFYGFNFIRSDCGRLTPLEGKAILEGWGMKWVPIVDTEYHMPNDIEEFKLYADAMSAVNPDVRREGVVLRDPICNLSFKNVSRKYMEKHS